MQFKIPTSFTSPIPAAREKPLAHSQPLRTVRAHMSASSPPVRRSQGRQGPLRSPPGRPRRSAGPIPSGRHQHADPIRKESKRIASGRLQRETPENFGHGREPAFTRSDFRDGSLESRVSQGLSQLLTTTSFFGLTNLVPPIGRRPASLSGVFDVIDKERGGTAFEEHCSKPLSCSQRDVCPFPQKRLWK